MSPSERCRRIEARPAFVRTMLGVILLAGVVVGLETSPAVMAHAGGLPHALERVVLALFVLAIALELVARAPRPLDGEHWTDESGR